MGTKDSMKNFNKAMFDIFGVGKAGDDNEDLENELFVAPKQEKQEKPEQPEQKKEQQPAPAAPQPVVRVQQQVVKTSPQPVQVRKVEASDKAVAEAVERNVFNSEPIRSSYFAPGTVLEGNLHIEGDVELAGELKGELEATGCATLRVNMNGNVKASRLNLCSCKINGNVCVKGTLIVDKDSSIIGDVRVGVLECSGRIRGNVEASSNSAFFSTAKLDGDVTTGTITVEKGASISGSVCMQSKKKEEFRNGFKTVKKDEE